MILNMYDSVIEATETADPARQLELIQSNQENVMCWVASNPNLIPELQHKLLQFNHDHINEWLAQNPALIPDIQKELMNAKANTNRIKSYLASNINLEFEFFNILLADFYNIFMDGIKYNRIYNDQRINEKIKTLSPII